MVIITPPDPSFKLKGWLLLLFALAVLSWLPREFLYRHSTRLVLTVIFPILTYIVLVYRYVTPERVAAMRLALPATEFRREMRFRPVFTQKRLSSDLRSIASMAYSANLLLEDGVDGEIINRSALGWTIWAQNRICPIVLVLTAISTWYFILFEGWEEGRKVKDADGAQLSKLNIGTQWAVVERRGREQTLVRRVYTAELEKGEMVYELVIRQIARDGGAKDGRVLRIALPGRKMATITPPDRSFRLHAWGLLAIRALLVYLMLSRNRPMPYRLLQTVLIDVIPTVVFFFVAHRNVTFERVAALRYTMPTKEFQEMMRLRPMMDSEAIGTLGNMCFIAMILHMDYDDFERTPLSAFGLAAKLFVGSILMYFLYKVGLALKEGRRAAKLASENDVPLNKKGLQGVWACLGSSRTRKEEVWARKVTQENVYRDSEKEGTEKDGEEVYELAVIYAREHKHFTVELEGIPIRKILRITC